MLAKVALSKQAAQDETPRQKGQQRPAEERYRLRVDGQFKQSFKAKEAALTAGGVIKKGYPVVRVTVDDAETGNVEILA